MASLSVEALLGISTGLLVGVGAALVVGGLAFASSYWRDVDLPRYVTVGVAIVLASGSAVAVGVIAPEPSSAPRAFMAALTVSLLALYAQSQGEWLADSIPKDVSLPTYRGRTLSGEAVTAIDGMGQVTIGASGGVRDVDGYPPLPPALRSTLEETTWQLPADLPLTELERRLEDRLRSEQQLAFVSVTIDARGRATIEAAPPAGGIAGRVPDGCRAVTIEGLVPTGLTAGDEVHVGTTNASVTGTVLSTDVPEHAPDPDQADIDGRVRDSTDPSPTGDEPDPSVVAGVDGGYGRVTVAVPTATAGDLLEDERGRIVATSRGTRHDYEALALLDDEDVAVRLVPLDEELAATLSDDATGVECLAVRPTDESSADRGDEWTFEPDERELEGCDAAFVVGDATALASTIGGDPAVGPEVVR